MDKTEQRESSGSPASMETDPGLLVEKPATDQPADDKPVVPEVNNKLLSDTMKEFNKSRSLFLSGIPQATYEVNFLLIGTDEWF